MVMMTNIITMERIGVWDKCYVVVAIFGSARPQSIVIGRGIMGTELVAEDNADDLRDTMTPPPPTSPISSVSAVSVMSILILTE